MKSKFMRVAGAVVAAATALTMIAGCSGGADSDNGKDGSGQVYYLSFKPEQDEQWQKIAKAYTEETGVPVKVVTAASGTYEQTLKAEIAKKDAPTLFQINGPVGMQVWKDYTADLSKTDFYNALLDKSMAVGEDGKIFGVPYVSEGYGIIYNQAIMDKYFALPGAKAKSVDEITDFDSLKAVVEDMQSKKDELGIQGVFASTSLKPGEDWRWQTHLANMPIHYEYADAGVNDMNDVTFKYNKEFKNIFDLYLNNSTIDPKLASSKAVADSMAEFALGQAAMVQNGNWAYSQVSEVAGNTVTAENVKMLPIYTGMPNDSKQGICIGTENYFSINSQASEADQKASIDFVNWLISSDQGKKAMVEDLGFIPPFNTFKDDERPDDPLAKEVIRYMSDSKYENVPWDFLTFPSQQFKDDFGQALSQYSAGQEDWQAVVDLFVNEWKAEKGA
uniref:ABC transporter substrate-binding protein n=1 Tax=Vaginimicrobium propionicum TaxID=1871034 RepID=UPI000970AB3D|nr:ABC transporter substrate-binding protein [Vaginimicrobium propionicum]